MKHIENTLQSAVFKLIIKYNKKFIKEEYYLFKNDAVIEKIILERYGFKCTIIIVPNVYV